MIYKISAKSSCSFCRGMGQVADWVDYGSAIVPMYSICDCILNQLPFEFNEHTDSVEIIFEMEFEDID